jgi:hypothetical protein
MPGTMILICTLQRHARFCAAYCNRRHRALVVFGISGLQRYAAVAGFQSTRVERSGNGIAESIVELAEVSRKQPYVPGGGSITCCAMRLPKLPALEGRFCARWRTYVARMAEIDQYNPRRMSAPPTAPLVDVFVAQHRFQQHGQPAARHTLSSTCATYPGLR